MSDIGFALNYTNIHLLRLPDGSWARIGAGITSIDPAGNESVAQDAYYDGEGLASSEVTGGQQTYSYKGHRVYGDPAQDYIASLALDYGAGRKARLRWIAPDGSIIEGDCTIVNIKNTGGDANSKSTFEFELHLNGRPTFTAGDADTFPDSISASPVSVAVGNTVAVVATVSPDDASDSLVYAIEDTTKATVDATGNVKGVAQGETKITVKSAVKPTVGVEVAVVVTDQ